ncbi:uncharacterized protein LOC119105855 [Pollicipes pollicipes]|uniref:uncharacterized protein LOC119105855 n=1 Tax=Pollicipes pollicipes TaxID=41117 RepID=UPI001884D0D0|nr:uncharacterized protein LOC119105855 [Pollicipes pollicipes]
MSSSGNGTRPRLRSSAMRGLALLWSLWPLLVRASRPGDHHGAGAAGSRQLTGVPARAPARYGRDYVGRYADRARLPASQGWATAVGATRQSGDGSASLEGPPWGAMTAGAGLPEVQGSGPGGLGASLKTILSGDETRTGATKDASELGGIVETRRDSTTELLSPFSTLSAQMPGSGTGTEKTLVIAPSSVALPQIRSKQVEGTALVREDVLIAHNSSTDSQTIPREQSVTPVGSQVAARGQRVASRRSSTSPSRPQIPLSGIYRLSSSPLDFSGAWPALRGRATSLSARGSSNSTQARTGVYGSVFPLLDSVLTFLGYLAFATFAALLLMNIINNNNGGGGGGRDVGTTDSAGQWLEAAGNAEAFIRSGAWLAREMRILVTDSAEQGREINRTRTERAGEKRS